MASISLNSNQQQIAATLYNVFTTQWGCTPEGACGILGNMWGESGLKPSSVNPNDVGKESIGLCQWRGNRNTGLRNYAQQKGLKWSDLEAQIGWLYQELTTRYTTVFETVKTTNSTDEASYVWGNKFEIFAGYDDRNSKSHVKRRGYSAYMLEGIRSGNWQAKEISEIDYSTDSSTAYNTSTTSYSGSSGSYGSTNGISVKAEDISAMEYGANKVHNLDKARKRPRGAEPSVDDKRKDAFKKLRDNLCKSAPDMGREFDKSAEMYDPSVLKGDQVSKSRLNT